MFSKKTLPNVATNGSGVSYSIITAPSQHFSSSISQMHWASLHGDWVHWPQHEAVASRKEGH